MDLFPKGKSKFLGSVKNGMRIGKGIELYSDGSRLECEWLDDQANGYGIL